MTISIVYADSKNYSGIKSYALNLYSDLSKEMDTVLKPIPKIEISIGNKRIGGVISQRLLTCVVRKTDIVHSVSYNLTPHTNVATIHDLYTLTLDLYKNSSKFEKNGHLRFLRRIKDRNIKVIVPSPMIAEDVRKFIDADITVIPTKVFVQPPTANPYPNDNKLHLLTMGEVYNSPFNRKRVFELFEWIKDVEGVELYHIGRMENPEYNNYTKNIHLLGSVNQQTKFNYMAYADKFIFKTLGEGQGFPVMEAMKLDVQTVVNDLPEHRFFLGDKPYYYNTKDEFYEMIWKPKKHGLIEQISQYDNWIEKYKKVYEAIE